MSVGGEPGAGVDAVDLGASGGRELGGFEDEHAGSLAHDESVAAEVVWTRGGHRIVVAGRECAHGGEAGHRDRVDACLGAAGDDDIGAPGLNHACSVGNGLGTGGACAHGGVHAGTGTDLKADDCGRPVRHDHRDHVRGDPGGAALEQGVIGVHERGDAANAGCDHRAEPVGVDLGRTGVSPRLAGGNEGCLLGPVHLANVNPVEDFGRINRHDSGDF
ncbi:unannotated protein [freshwater metagenome]|uniref:Unannotated protein n=1 Tax=freshwater metagenome TaxID=449393 RepID=A0A6J7NYB2_9ZZZZ